MSTGDRHQFTHSAVTRWTVTAVAAVGSAGLAGYVFLVDPNNPTNAYPKCPLKALTGLDCPGCGGLRATHSLLHGDLVGAMHHNVLALIIVPVMAFFLVRAVLKFWDVELPDLRWPTWSRWALPAFLLAFTVLRNIPNQPLYYFNSFSA